MLNLRNFVSSINEEKLQVDTHSKHRIKWAVNEPQDDDATSGIDLDSEENTEAMEDLIAKFEVEKPFFIQGMAGWGKTSVVKSLAKKFNMEVITVYLDKAEAVDLGGIPVPVGKKIKVKPIPKDGKVKPVATAKEIANKEVEEKEYVAQMTAMPDWARKMLDNPDTFYLLFFDEMNQAQPDVMNALMPIVKDNVICQIKFDNFFVGAAGNFESENSAIQKLSGPLQSRFGPTIVWESDTPRAWKQAFKDHVHQKWDKVIGKDLIDKFEQCASCFHNPREIEDHIIEEVYRMKVKGVTRNKVTYWARKINNIAKSEDELEATQIDQLQKLAEACYNFVQGNDTKNDEGDRRKSKDENMVSEEVQTVIKSAIQKGYFTLRFEDEDGNEKRVNFGASEDTIAEIIGPDEITPEMLKRTIRKFKTQLDCDWKYHKREEIEFDKYEDPLSDKWSNEEDQQFIRFDQNPIKVSNINDVKKRCKYKKG